MVYCSISRGQATTTEPGPTTSEPVPRHSPWLRTCTSPAAPVVPAAPIVQAAPAVPAVPVVPTTPVVPAAPMPALPIVPAAALPSRPLWCCLNFRRQCLPRGLVELAVVHECRPIKLDRIRRHLPRGLVELAVVHDCRPIKLDRITRHLRPLMATCTSASVWCWQPNKTL